VIAHVWQRPSVRYAALAVAVAYLFYLAIARPYMFGVRNMTLALALVMLGFLAAGFETYFLPCLLAIFLTAGSNLPFFATMQTLRWGVLGVAAVLSIAYYARYGRILHFSPLHLLAALSAAAAFTSALVSYNPNLTLMKSASLAALVLYGSLGTRVIWYRSPERLAVTLARFADVMVYTTAGFHFLFSLELWGNPNSLGLIVGVICWPVCLWRFLLGAQHKERILRGFTLAICVLLVLSSGARAAMLGAAVSSALLLLCARRPRLLAIGTALLCVFFAGVYLLAPERLHEASNKLVYKSAERYQGVLISRLDPWKQSVDSIRAHPWLGTGYGVSEDSAEKRGDYLANSSTREHGSSYLKMLEGTGIAGSVPMILLFLGLLYCSGQVLFRLYLTRDLGQLGIPVACIVVGSLTHAAFEDWLVAVGYHMTVLFWLLALCLPDLVLRSGTRSATPDLLQQPG
jgi:O-antigen ligase